MDQEVTGDSAFSMFNLSLREEWLNNKRFCNRLSDDEDDDIEATTEGAHNRLEAVHRKPLNLLPLLSHESVQHRAATQQWEDAG